MILIRFIPLEICINRVVDKARRELPCGIMNTKTMGWYSELQVQLVGDFRLIYNGHIIDHLQTTRLQTLLAYLLLHREAPQSRQKIAFI
jgi:hypothetical protein